MIKKEVATPEKIEERDYLRISSEITQTDDVEVGLLIGANCMKALKSLKVIASHKDLMHIKHVWDGV